MTDSAILSTIKKLLALSKDQAATPSEAAAATAKAQTLLFKHNLNLAEVDGAGDDTGIGEEDLDLDTASAHSTKAKPSGFMVGWHRLLVHGLCRVNFCNALQYRNSARMSIIGEKHNVETVKFFYAYLSGEIKRLAAIAVKRECNDPRGGVRGQWVRDYCLGAASTVLKRLREQRAADERAARQTAQGETTALVLVKREELVRQWTEKKYPKLHKSAPMAGVTGHNAYSSGVRGGQSISLNRPVDGGTPRRSLR